MICEDTKYGDDFVPQVTNLRQRGIQVEFSNLPAYQNNQATR
jgi:hypothetical protein